jgi:polyphosphate kinase
MVSYFQLLLLLGWAAEFSNSVEVEINFPVGRAPSEVSKLVLPVDHSATAPNNSVMIPAWATGKNRYINRELSWLRFNERVLDEASNPQHPLMEQIRFLSISASNLDEFFVVRVSALREELEEASTQESKVDLAQRLLDLNRRSSKFLQKQQAVFTRLVGKLGENNLFISPASELNDGDRKWLDEYYNETVKSKLKSWSSSPVQKLPFLPNKGVGILLESQSNRSNELRIILLPLMLPRYIRLPSSMARPGEGPAHRHTPIRTMHHQSFIFCFSQAFAIT